tara:strand:+ start:23 stop:3190 length:3168 start_codon:yes stop_codon:yes gene_type:complete
MLRTFTHGSPSGVDLEKFEVYPALHVVYTGSTYENTSKEYSFEVYILDLPPDKAKKIENQTQLVSNAEQVAEDILSDMMNGGRVFDFGHLYTVSNASTTPLEETTSNSLAGILLTITIEVGFTFDSCNAPLIGVTPSGSEFPAASSSGLLEVRTQDGVPTVSKVTTIIVSNGTLVDNGLGVVTIDTDIPTNVYLPLTGGTLTGDLDVDADLTVTGEITADSNFISSDSTLVAATTGAGTILLRPNGKGVGLGQVILDAAGKLTTSGEAQVGGELNMSTNKITSLSAGSANLDAVNFQQFTDAITGILLYKGVWDADTNNPALASGVGDVGSYYIVSVSGITDLDGITDWVVGDWAVFSATEWQKIDNTSILGGVGTGGQLSKWTGSGTSRTLGDSIIAEIGSNIGIDTTSAPANLTLGDGTVSKVIRVYYSDGSYVDINGYGIVMNRGDSYIRPSGTGTQNMHFGTDANEWNNIAQRFSNLLLIYSGGLEKLRMDSSGRVGLGTNNPQSKLHIESGSGGAYTPNANHDDITIEGSSNLGIQFFGTEASYQYIAFGDPISVNIGYIRYQHGVDEMRFRTAGADKLVIASDGKVGIGIMIPTAKLHIHSGTTNTTALFESSDSAALIKIKDDTSELFVGTDAGVCFIGFNSAPDVNNLTILANGNVGIGTTAPAQKLEVFEGYMRIGDASNTGYGIEFERNNSIVGLVNTANNRVNIQASNNRDVELRDTAGTGNLILKDGGNVGIGTITPAVALDVNGGVRIGEDLGGELITNGDFSATGTDLVVDGDFPSGTTAWSLFNSTLESGGVRIQNPDAVTNAYISQGILGSPSGKSFVLTYDVISTNGALLAIEQLSSISLDTSTTGTNRKLYFTWDRANDGLIIKRQSANLVDITIDNVKLEELGADWTIINNGTSASFFGENKAQLVSSGGDYTDVTQLQTIDLGAAYKYSFEVVDYVVGAAFFQIGGATVVSGINADGVYSGYYTSPTGNDHLLFKRGGVTDLGITNVSVMEVDAPSSSIEGTMRYRKDANNSYVDMCMQTGSSTYAWVNIKTNNW